MNARVLVPSVLVVAVLAPLAAVLLSNRTEARPAEEPWFEFILQESERTDRGGRNQRESLALYRYRDFKYADERYTLLERYLFDIKDDFGIHNLLEKGFRFVELEHGGARTTFVVRIHAEDFAELVRHLR